MKTAVQQIFALLATALFLGGCGHRDGSNSRPSDAQLQRTITGTWTLEISNVEGVITLRPDSSFSGYWSNMSRLKGWSSEGDWKIADGLLVTKITNKTAWNYTLHGPTGTVDRVRILRLTDQELVAAVGNQTNKWRRKQ